MTGAQIITQTMEQFPESELIFASKLYTEQLSEAVSEEAYYQTLGRMCTLQNSKGNVLSA